MKLVLQWSHLQETIGITCAANWHVCAIIMKYNKSAVCIHMRQLHFTDSVTHEAEMKFVSWYLQEAYVGETDPRLF